MAVTLTNAITYVRSLLDEPTGTLSPMWSDLEITNWINEACAETQRKVEWKAATSTIPVTSNTQYYAAPPNLLRIHRVTFVQNYPGTTESPNTYTLEYRGFMEMDQLWGINQQWPASYPLYYTLWGQPATVANPSLGTVSTSPSSLQLILYPVPSQPGNLNVYYYPTIIPAVNTNDPVDAPTGFPDIIWNYAAYRAFLKDADPRWQQFKQLFDAQMIDLANSTEDYQDQGNYVSTGQVALPAWLINNDMGW